MNLIHEELVARIRKSHPQYGSLYIELIFHNDKLSKAKIFDRTEIILPVEIKDVNRKQAER
jgi:hypothetical protein